MSIDMKDKNFLINYLNGTDRWPVKLISNIMFNTVMHCKFFPCYRVTFRFNFNIASKPKIEIT